MRIALIGPVYPYRGGIAHYTTLLCRTLRDRGHEVLLISFRRQYPRWLYPGKSDKDPSQTPLTTEDAKYWIDSLNPLSWLTSFRRIRAFGPERLILQWWTLFWAPVWLVLGMLNRLLLRKPLVLVCHNVRPHEKKRSLRIVERLVLELADVCIVHSEEEKRYLLSMVPRTTVVKQQLPVFGLFSNGGELRTSARRVLGLPLRVPVFLFFGIVRPYKGLRDLIVAFSKVKYDLHRSLLVIAGEFWEPRQDYERLVGELGLGASVRIDDRYIPDEELKMYFSAADIVVAPYRSVTGSAVVQTARGFGLPVVATKVGSLSELADTDDCIMLVEAENGRALADAMVEQYRRSVLGEVHRNTPPNDGWHAVVETIEAACRCSCGGDQVRKLPHLDSDMQ